MSTPIAPRTPVERFASLLKGLREAVMARSGGDQLSYLLIGLIIDRLRGINQCFGRIAAKIRDRKYAPRRFAPHRKPAEPKPRQPSKLPSKFGWLLPLVPLAVGSRSQLQSLLGDPEMAALIAAAPDTLGRPLRSLCHMLGLRPPDISPLPAKPRPPRPPRKEPRPRKPRPEPLPPIGPPPPHPDAPWWLRMPPSRTRWLPGRVRKPKNRD